VAAGEAGRDTARAEWFADDDAQCEQEDWNLLYVAATRARQVLIVSGSQPRRNTITSSWYTTMQSAADLAAAPATVEAAFAEEPPRLVRDFLPEPVPTGRRRDEAADSDAMRLGRAWHALLESSDPAMVQSLAQEHGLDARQRVVATDAAARVRTAFPGFFSIGSAAEIEIVSGQGATLRIDRLVEDEHALWIIDFKWSMADAERDAYAAQLRRYAEVVQAIRPDKPVRLGIITSAGVLTEIQ
jgi:ATP-dependent helicase/nuclease subunit A